MPHIDSIPGFSDSFSSKKTLQTVSCSYNVQTGGKRQTPEIRITGSGEKCEDGGKPIKVGSCEERHYDHVIHKACFNRLCPTCWNSWAYRAQKRIYGKVRAYVEIREKLKKMQKGEIKGKLPILETPRLDYGDLKHVTVSPPQEWAMTRMETVSGLKYMRQKCIKLIKEAGAKGGVTVFHPRRMTRKGKDEWQNAMKERSRQGIKNNGLGKWAWLRSNGLLENPDYTYISPHFHLFLYGFLDYADDFSKKTGWIYNNIRSIRGKRDLKGVIMYVLSHAGWDKKGKVISYFGQIHNLSRRLMAKEYEGIICEECGEKEYEVDGWEVDESDNISIKWTEEPEVTEFPIIRKIEVYKYWLRSHPRITVNIKIGGVDEKERHTRKRKKKLPENREPPEPPDPSGPNREPPEPPDPSGPNREPPEPPGLPRRKMGIKRTLMGIMEETERLHQDTIIKEMGLAGITREKTISALDLLKDNGRIEGTGMGVYRIV